MKQFFDRFFSVIAAALKFAFGNINYTPPKWIAKLRERFLRSRAGQWLAARTAKLRAKVQANPAKTRKVSGLIALTVLLAIAAYIGITNYLDSLPKPDYVTVTLQKPNEPNLETGKNDELNVKFSRSAAKIDALDKNVQDGVEISPDIKGSWRWTSDQNLMFTPLEPWKIGQKYTVKFTRKLFPDHVLLSQISYDFETPDVSGSFSKREFYQDPRDPQIKRVVFNLRYNYALDTEDFKKRVSLTLQTRDQSVLKAAAKTIPYNVTFGKFGNEAFIISDPIPIPKEDSVSHIEIAEGVRAANGGATKSKLEENVDVPGVFDQFKFEDTHVTFARNDRFEPEQILVLHSKAELPSETVAKGLKLWLLPKKRANDKSKAPNSHWSSASEVTNDERSKLVPVKFTVVPSAEENSNLHTFKIDVPVGRYVYLEVPAGMKSFGGYELKKKYEAVVGFPEYPRELMIMSQGALLSLSGDKKIPLLGRNIHDVSYKLHRVLPGQLNQFIFNNYRYGNDLASPNFDLNTFQTLSEAFSKDAQVTFVNPAKTQFFSLDLEPFLSKDPGNKKGLFYLTVNSKQGGRDQRLILLTDLGVIVKEMNDRNHTVFVQNLRTGQPVAGAEVDVMGTNGISVVTQRTDNEGKASFPDLTEFKNEKKPIAFVVKKDGDLSFLPFQMSGRNLGYSKFDVGGIRENVDSDQLTAFLFSDRGIYRPGDSVNIGMMVRAKNWKNGFAKLPISWSVTDTRGAEVHREKLEIGSNDLTSLSFSTQDSWPTGVYNIQVFITNKDKRDEQIGSLTVRIEEFMPDRMKISATLSGSKAQGWISPVGIKGHVSLKNLFGTPAEDRRVIGELTLTPTRPFFKAFKDYQFSVLKGDEKSFNETLPAQQTSASGEADFEFDLARFTTGMYNLRFDAEGFESQGGRAVSASASMLVSARTYLVGVKADGNLSFVPKNSAQKVSIIAINQDLKTVSPADLQLVLVEKRYVSALMQQPDGTYKYHSVLKEIPREPKPFVVSEKGSDVKLPTDLPGTFVYIIKDKAGAELNRFEFSVAGVANLTRSLENNAELQVSLDKTDYKSSDEISLHITAPYTGAGLITIERDRVYAVKWFKTGTTSTVEKIKIPAGLEGNAYVNVTFLRAIDSKEIFMSPLSYAVKPFSISLDEHKIALTLNAPTLVKPGDKLKISYSASRKSKIILYGVDEGILQVARYKLPDPLTYFFQRRALQVRTYQLLDLLLPEYSVVQKLSSPGGDDEARLAKNLNPFKRKTDKPVVFWSGVLDAGPEKKEFSYDVPDYFNGNIKVLAVATNGAGFGTQEQGVVSRGDFIISPNMPNIVVPGDEFEVGVGISNQAEGTGDKAQVKLEVTADAFEFVGEPLKALTIAEGRESSTSFKLRAKTKFGSQPIRFRASSGAKFAKASMETSIRPAVPYMTEIFAGVVQKSSFDVAVPRQLVPEFRKQTAALSPVPLLFADGLKTFLDAYPYGCTEQLTSKAFPYVILKTRPEFKIDLKQAQKAFAGTIAQLRARQTSDGGFAMYDPSAGANEPASLYVTHLLLEAKERGFQVPEEMLTKALSYIETIRDMTTIEHARAFAYALYLRARSGRVPGNDVSFLHKALTTNYKEKWSQDLAAGWLAATYKILKKDEEARAIFSKLRVGEKVPINYDYFYDGFVRDTALIFLAARHFSELVKEFANEKAMAIAFAPLSHGVYNTHSASFSIMALDAIFSVAAKAELLSQMKIDEVQAKGVTKVLPLPTGTVIPTVAFSEAAQKIRFGVPEKLTFYFTLLQAGFDRDLPKAPIQKELEVTREYLTPAGTPIMSAKMGDEVTVRLRIRATNFDAIRNIALVDMLPSGLEPILEPVNVASASESVYQGNLPGKKRKRPSESYEGEGGEGTDGGEGGYEPNPESEDYYEPPQAPPFEVEGAFLRIFNLLVPEALAADVKQAVATVVAAMQTQYVDRREDRMIVYTMASKAITEFKYRAKAVSKGSFVVPPAFAQSMYDRNVEYRGMTSTFKVEAP